MKEELTKNHTLISQNFFLEKTVVTINLIRAELNQLEKILEDIEKKIGSTFAFCELDFIFKTFLNFDSS